jgi:hypothetical protein
VTAITNLRFFGCLGSTPIAGPLTRGEQELNGDDLWGDPLAMRKATLERMLASAAPGIRFNEHLDHDDGPLVFHHACKLGLEGIVSKRRDSVYSSGRSAHWIKSKNPNAPATKRELEDDWEWRKRDGKKDKARSQSGPQARGRRPDL